MKRLCLLAALSGALFAQPKDPDTVVMIFTDVIPTMTAEFAASNGALLETYKKNAVPFRLGYVPLFGSRHLTITPVKDLSLWDKGPMVQTMMGDAAYQQWVQQYRRTISRADRVVAKRVPDLSIEDAPRGSLPILLMQRTRVAFDRRAEFEARLRNTVIPAMRKAGVKRMIVSRVLFGGPSNEYIITRSHNGLVEAEKANQVSVSLPLPAGLVLSNERTVYRVSPGMSFSQGVQIK